MQSVPSVPRSTLGSWYQADLQQWCFRDACPDLTAADGPVTHGRNISFVGRNLDHYKIFYFLPYTIHMHTRVHRCVKLCQDSLWWDRFQGMHACVVVTKLFRTQTCNLCHRCHDQLLVLGITQTCNSGALQMLPQVSTAADGPVTHGQTIRFFGRNLDDYKIFYFLPYTIHVHTRVKLCQDSLSRDRFQEMHACVVVTKLFRTQTCNLCHRCHDQLLVLGIRRTCNSGALEMLPQVSTAADGPVTHGQT